MRKDTYQKWVDAGKLDENLELIRKYYSYKEYKDLIYKLLGISESTWERMKKKYVDIKDAMKEGKQLHEHLLIVHLTERSKGQYIEETHTLIEESGGKQKKKITKFKKYIPGDVAAGKYLLSRLHGEKYNENIEMIELARDKHKTNKEEWSNETNADQED